MITASRVMVTAAAAGVLASIAAGAQVSAPPLRLDPNGNYVISYRHGGSVRELVFVPATKVEPSITVQVRPEQPGQLFYEYTIQNGAGAAQELYSITIVANRPSRLVSTPVGWEGGEVESRGRFYWYRISSSGQRRGIEPGGQRDSFVIASELLPGPSTAECRGNVGPPTIPSVLPEPVVQQLSALMRNDFVSVPVIAPVIPSGMNEPELTRAVFLSRIVHRFAMAIQRSSHPLKADILRDLERAIGSFEVGATQEGETLVREIRMRLQQPAEGWAAEWAKALAFNLDHLAQQDWPPR